MTATGPISAGFHAARSHDVAQIRHLLDHSWQILDIDIKKGKLSFRIVGIG
jgi:hypothetical protein